MAINWQDFTKIEMRVGTILSAEVFEEARNPAYKMTIDFGKLGVKKTSAQITKLYDPKDLIGKQIANMMSECLVLGGVEEEEKVILIEPERGVENGTRVG